jgi:hypothetical protein
MKLTALSPTSSSPPATTRRRAPLPGSEEVKPVDALAGLGSDRERSLQQEIDSIEAQAIGDFAGEEHMLEKAQHLAAEVSHLGRHIDSLIKAGKPRAQPFPVIDDEV